MVPLTMMLILMLIPAIMAAVSLVREKEIPSAVHWPANIFKN